MIKVSVLYPNRKGMKFDMTYYLQHHIPMVRQLLSPALKSISVDQGLSGEEPGSLAPYHAMAHLVFDSVQDFQTSFGPHAEPIMADIVNYTDSEPVVQISDILL
jgi:uncharacterized protein (TIGR02118 family)